MAKYYCAISGLQFTLPGLGQLNIPVTAGYFHPIFAAPQKELYKYYTLHCKGELSSEESYLTFLAILHSSDKVTWKRHVTLNPDSSTTIQLIENNIAQLVAVIEKTNAIKHPSFKQPEYIVNNTNSDLTCLQTYITEWQKNIEEFYTSKATRKEVESLQKLENSLTERILSGDKPEKYASTIADWAARAADFPADKEDSYKSIIRTCFNPDKMFSTPLATIKEVQEFCICNIEAGSIHFHELYNTLNIGVTNHIDYLGVAIPLTDFTVLPNLESSDSITNKLDSILSDIPKSEPVESEYKSKLDFIRAKLAYRAGNKKEIIND